MLMKQIFDLVRYGHLGFSDAKGPMGCVRDEAVGWLAMKLRAGLSRLQN
jgi:hypothetical protein